MRLTVTVPDEIAEAARDLAAESDTSVSALVAEAIAEYVTGERRRRAAERIQAAVAEADVAPDAVEVLHEMRRESDRPVDLAYLRGLQESLSEWYGEADEAAYGDL